VRTDALTNQSLPGLGLGSNPIIDFNDDYFLVVSPSDTQKNVVGAPNELAFYYSSCIDCYGCSVHIENWRFGVGKW